MIVISPLNILVKFYMKRTNKESPSELFSKTGGTPLRVQEQRPPETKSSERITFSLKLYFQRSKLPFPNPSNTLTMMIVCFANNTWFDHQRPEWASYPFLHSRDFPMERTFQWTILGLNNCEQNVMRMMLIIIIIIITNTIDYVVGPLETELCRKYLN